MDSDDKEDACCTVACLSPRFRYASTNSPQYTFEQRLSGYSQHLLQEAACKACEPKTTDTAVLQSWIITKTALSENGPAMRAAMAALAHKAGAARTRKLHDTTTLQLQTTTTTTHYNYNPLQLQPTTTTTNYNYDYNPKARGLRKALRPSSSEPFSPFLSCPGRMHLSAQFRRLIAYLPSRIPFPVPNL